MAASAEFTEAAVGEADDALRALLSSILSGRYKQELYLWHVSELCRDDPESAVLQKRTNTTQVLSALEDIGIRSKTGT